MATNKKKTTAKKSGEKTLFEIRRYQAAPQYAVVCDKSVREFERRLKHVQQLGRIAGYRKLTDGDKIPTGFEIEVLTPDDILKA